MWQKLAFLSGQRQSKNKFKHWQPGQRLTEGSDEEMDQHEVHQQSQRNTAPVASSRTPRHRRDRAEVEALPEIRYRRRSHEKGRNDQKVQRPRSFLTSCQC